METTIKDVIGCYIQSYPDCCTILTSTPFQSVSDDSVDLGGSDKQSGAKSSPKLSRKTTVSWWQDDEHSDGATGRGNNQLHLMVTIYLLKVTANKITVHSSSI